MTEMSAADKARLLSRLEDDQRLWRAAFDEGRRHEQALSGNAAMIPVLGVKATREALCAAQSALGQSVTDVDRVPHWIARLQMLINELDVHRPLGPDGTHGDRHTATCGCEDKP